MRSACSASTPSGRARSSAPPSCLPCSSTASGTTARATERTMPQFGNVTQGLRFRVVLKPGVALGPGKADLLQAIDETASPTGAAARFGMSYKRSWTLVQEMNAAFTQTLVETEK